MIDDILAVDIRNDGIVAGFHTKNNGWSRIHSFGLDRSPDELGILLEASAKKAGFSDKLEFGQAWVSNVVPAAADRVSAAIKSGFGIDSQFIKSGIKTGLKIKIDNPNELGSDIVCSCVAAMQKVKLPFIVVNFGVAITFSLVDETGALTGVSIVPGLETSVLALRKTAAQLPDVRIEIPKSALGKNTPESIRSGIIIGFGGLVSRIIEKMSLETATEINVIGTGTELGRLILSQEGYDNFEPHLVLDGLVAIAERNKA